MITILGPTASGKTTLAAHLAEHLGNAEIISADSRQVYRGMDIGTGKDLCDYTVNGVHIPYHLIDIADAGSKYNLFQYQHDFVKAYDDIMARGATPILCGGTGLYLESVIKGYHLSAVPENKELRDRLSDKTLEELTVILTELKKRNGSNMHNTTDVDTAKRAIRAIEIETFNGEHPMASADVPNIDTLVIGVDIDREERRSKISKRLRDRLDNGMVDEIRGLLDGGIPADDLIYYGLEYKYVTEYAIGRLTYEEMFEKLEIAIHQFAKRQMTWFRGMERRGTTIHWVDASLSMEEKIQYIKRLWQ
ncbi:MAG: tRNA (adenosine(37)-N6)-dimethylallyltransferase MiaA [Prevotella sp.]|nr:tRNA (adenosine(37)-N6)-dimethylallyltransferase MiaA [Prevotellaceae bacterium]MDY4889941.1 tRNA (adenosine(37)-N6)-dimethylallyltransferase MiaA [Prevotella sp.]MDY5006340.1 tRNA (adenosine(37)-N6)-dimethylallyltransferase MiaA [Prevotella sp.]MDY5251094.1 tRNA (adenosine(37)-N6)-dimethylallyltransferase MiaA [Prevotella sp.]